MLRLVAILVVALSGALGASVAAGESVPVLLASDAAPYVRAYEAFVEAHGGDCPRLVIGHQGLDLVGSLAGARVVVAIGTPAAVWAHGNLPPDASLVFCMVAGPEDTVLAQQPPAHGVATDVPLAEQVALIARALPDARRIGLIHRRDAQGERLLATVRAALPAGFAVEAVAVDGAANAAAIDEILGRRIDVVWTSADGGVYNEAAVKALLLGALRRRVPVFGFSPAFVRAGALLGVGIDPLAQGRQAAAIAREIALSAPAAPLRPAPLFEIALNLVVAKKLNVSLPAALVDHATHVFRPER
ncbi:MAG TPA: ABC transporter substrate binding protein [Planctomycetota bacterium]|nr:ABC transporter substrate binding protein [Planctomycetota bacterium]